MRLTDPRVLTTLVLGMLFTGVFAFAVYTASLDDSVFQAPTIKADVFYVGAQTLATYIASVAPGGASLNVTDSTYLFKKIGVTYYAYHDGAVFTSGTDFDTALQLVVADAAAGDTVCLQPAIYYLDEEIVVNKGLSIYSGGYDTTVSVNGVIAGAVFKLTASYTYISGMTIDCNAQADYGIRFYGGSRCEIYRVDVENAVLDNYRLDYTSQRTGNKIVQSIAGDAGRYNIYVGDNQTDNWIVDCTIKDSNEDGSTDAGIAVDGAGQQILGCHIYGCRYGILFSPTISTVRHVVNDNYIESNADVGIMCGGSTHGLYDVAITGNMFWSNAETKQEWDIKFNHTATYFVSRIAITGNTFQGQAFVDYGIYLGARAVSNTIIGNTLNDYDVATIYLGAAGNTVIGNEGFVTENRGTGQIASATTSDVITHLMDYTPTIGDITITLSNNPPNSFGHIWISAVDATEFTVSCESDPGAGGLNFSWHINRHQLET